MNNIFYLLHEKKMTQKRLADLMGKQPPYISQLVKRDNLDCTQYGTLKEVAKHLGVAVSDLETQRPIKIKVTK